MVGIMFQKGFSEEALSEFPVLWEKPLLFEQGMHPGDWSLYGWSSVLCFAEWCRGLR